MLERRADIAFDYDLHDSAQPMRMQWHIFDTSNSPAAVQSWEISVGEANACTHTTPTTSRKAKHGPGDSVLAAADPARGIVNTGPDTDSSSSGATTAPTTTPDSASHGQPQQPASPPSPDASTLKPHPIDPHLGENKS